MKIENAGSTGCICGEINQIKVSDPSSEHCPHSEDYFDGRAMSRLSLLWSKKDPDCCCGLCNEGECPL